VADSIEQLTYEMSLRALEEQERAVSGMRARAGTVLAAASISASFLGTKSSVASGLDAWSVVALIAFAATFATAVRVLWPNPFTFAFEGRALLAESDKITGGVEVTEGYRAAVIWMAPWVESNRGGIEDLTNRLGWSCGLLLLEVALWTLSFT
jgi:hypothetical protein